MENDISKEESLRSQIKTASDYGFYAMQRIDVLLISVAGAGIYACWEVYQFILELIAGGSCINLLLIKLSAVLFLSTIILNFIGQWASYEANSNAEKALDHELSEVKHNAPRSHIRIILKARKCAKIYNKIVKCTNIISLVTIIAGLLSLSIFIFHFL